MEMIRVMYFESKKSRVRNISKRIQGRDKAYLVPRVDESSNDTQEHIQDLRIRGAIGP